MGRPKNDYKSYGQSKGLPKPKFYICKRTFARVVRNEMERHTGMNYRIAKDALLALQEGAEAMLIGLFEDAQICMRNTIAKRATLGANDIRAAQELRTATLSVLAQPKATKKAKAADTPAKKDKKKPKAKAGVRKQVQL